MPTPQSTPFAELTDRLLAILREHANPFGLACLRLHDLAQEAQLSSEHALELLEQLSSEDRIELMATEKFVVVKVGSWSGEGRAFGGQPGENLEEKASPYSSDSKLLHTQEQRIEIASYREEEQGDSPLLQEILDTLGETDPAGFRKVIDLYAPAVIHQALRRVHKAHAIKKNRTALFRYLLPRIAREFPPAKK